MQYTKVKLESHSPGCILKKEIHADMYGDPEEEGIPATFQILNFIGWKPDPTQVLFFH
jgi:hypothetical protein